MLFTHELLKPLVPQQAEHGSHIHTILRVNTVFQGATTIVLKLGALISLNADKLARQNYEQRN